MAAKNQYQILVEKFLKPEKINWPREIKIAKKLLKSRSFEFWNGLELGFKLNSLAYFLSANGVFYINQLTSQEKLDSLVKKVDNIEVAGEKIEPIKTKPKTLIEFLDS